MSIKQASIDTHVIFSAIYKFKDITIVSCAAVSKKIRLKLQLLFCNTIRSDVLKALFFVYTKCLELYFRAAELKCAELYLCFA